MDWASPTVEPCQSDSIVGGNDPLGALHFEFVVDSGSQNAMEAINC